jgi:hypothetical protein
MCRIPLVYFHYSMYVALSMVTADIAFFSIKETVGAFCRQTQEWFFAHDNPYNLHVSSAKQILSCVSAVGLGISGNENCHGFGSCVDWCTGLYMIVFLSSSYWCYT